MTSERALVAQLRPPVVTELAQPGRVEVACRRAFNTRSRRRAGIGGNRAHEPPVALELGGDAADVLCVGGRVLASESGEGVWAEADA
ncbi:MAG TPA: hypothetical protein VN213_15550, partial [Solirubrobacteraceae bacterium]|nr:hypothetical protein [Solirubrobacteraceae bacterium]